MKTFLRFLLVLWGFLAAWTLCACAPIQESSPADPWLYADLRSLEPPSGRSPTFDLVAAYTRLAGNDFQIRLDLLELDLQAPFDLYLALDTGPGGRTDLPTGVDTDIAWEMLVSIPATAQPQVFHSGSSQSTWTPDASLIPRVVYLPWNDTLVVSLNARNMRMPRSGFKLQAFLFPHGDPLALDTLGPLPSDGSPPGRAKVLLAFWDTFPAYTPAQGLRRWDGAHTGPYGERHGLYPLLQAVRRTRVPVVLLDLKTPASLSALDYLGKLDKIHTLTQEELLILPDAVPGSPGFPYFPSQLPGWAWEQAIQDSRQGGKRFDLPASRLLYAPVLPTESANGYGSVFTRLTDNLPASWRKATLLPVPLPGLSAPVDKEGIPLEVRIQLLEEATSSGSQNPLQPPVLFGGSLPVSPLGDPQVAASVLGYIAAHPWIYPLRADDLTAIQPLTETESLYPVGQAPYSSTLTGLEAPRPGVFDRLGLSAWQAALSLYAPLPPEPKNLAALRGLYSSHPAAISSASAWANSPSILSTCREDLDLDGKPECLLASEQVYAILDPLGGRLVWLFARSPEGVHQLVGPSSQLMVGLSDPSAWDLARGEEAEPGLVQGAFGDQPGPWQTYLVEQVDHGVMFTSPDGQVQKTFRITPSGLRVEFRTSNPVSFTIPVIGDPWRRFQENWAASFERYPLSDGFAWQLEGGDGLEVHASVPLRIISFVDSRPHLNVAENPNFAYPPGHYLTFPLVLISGEGESEFSIDISFVP